MKVVISMCKQFTRSEFSEEETVKTFEMFWNQHRITPGDIIKLSESSREYRFSSLETAVESGVSWMNVHDLQDNFKIKSYCPKHLRGVVRKKSFNG
jgi:hypothetical protein